jgi:hypothetical protein
VKIVGEGGAASLPGYLHSEDADNGSEKGTNMKVQEIVREGSAEITRIVEVRPGDVYKRFDKPSYGENRIVYGQVLDVLNDGTDVVVETIEFAHGSWGQTIEPRMCAYGSNSEVAIFPTREEEWRDALGSAAEIAHRNVETAARDLERKKEIAARLEHVLTSHPVQQPVITDQPQVLSIVSDTTTTD